MRFTVNNGGIRSAAKTEILAIPLFSDDLGSTHVREVDAAAGGALSALRTIGEATGRRFSASLAAGGRLPADHLLFVGAGARGGTAGVGSLASSYRVTAVRPGPNAIAQPLPRCADLSSRLRALYKCS